MYIVSNFHDYYDTAISYGIDKEVVYLRKEESFRLKLDVRLDDYGFEGYHYNMILCRYLERHLLVGFCGKIYPLIVLRDSLGKGDLFFYSSESLLDFLESNNFLFKKEKKYYTSRIIFSKGKIREFFEHSVGLERIFFDYGVPIFLIRSKTHVQKEIVLNPVLRDVEFYKVRDSFSAFQEIHQYLSGVLGSKEKEVVGISDRDKIQQHGYDKWSFRKLPRSK